LPLEKADVGDELIGTCGVLTAFGCSHSLE